MLKSEWNCCRYSSSAPGRPPRDANLNARSVLFSVRKMYGMIVSGSTLTLSTWPRRFTAIMPFELFCSAATNTVSPETRFM